MIVLLFLHVFPIDCTRVLVNSNYTKISNYTKKTRAINFIELDKDDLKLDKMVQVINQCIKLLYNEMKQFEFGMLRQACKSQLYLMHLDFPF